MLGNTKSSVRSVTPYALHQFTLSFSQSFSMSSGKPHQQDSLPSRSSRTDLTCPDVSSPRAADSVSGTLFNRSAGSIVRSEYNEMVVGSRGGAETDSEGGLSALAKVNAEKLRFEIIILSFVLFSDSGCGDHFRFAQSECLSMRPAIH